MKFCLVNASKDPMVSAVVMQRMASVCEIQLFEHLGPFWEIEGAPVSVISDEGACPEGASLLVVLDDSDIAGDLGYHGVTPQGRAYARTFWKPIKDAGGSLLLGANSLAVTVSHELVEASVDPYASLWAFNPITGKVHALEPADPVESDAYDIEGVSVSNFVGPRFYRPGDGPYDWLRLCSEPFKTRTEYDFQIVGDSPLSAEGIFGSKYPEWKRAGKTHAASRTARRLVQGAVLA